LQLEDGGWAVSGNKSDADVTAMTLQALAPYYNDMTDRAARGRQCSPASFGAAA